MEQLRLISNLEKETGKLIQIILVGQPELERILSKKEMRQLDQRVVVRGLLGPFKSNETNNYIRHRMKIATNATAENVTSFSDGACKTIHKMSGGVPRLINIVADRSLLVAYAQGKRKIEKATVKKAYRDLESSHYRPKSRIFLLRWQTVGIFCIFLMALWGWLYQVSFTKNEKKTVKQSEPAQAKANVLQPATPVVSPPEASKEVKVEVSTEEIINRLFSPMERISKKENWGFVLNAVFELWGEKGFNLSAVAVGRLPKGSQLNIGEVYGNMTLLKSLNYPAIVSLKRPKHDSGIFAVLKKLRADSVVMVGGSEVEMPVSVFYDLWYGHGYIVWKDFEKLPRVIYTGSSSRAVTWLQHNLRYLKLFDGQPSGFYNYSTKEAITRLQKEHNLYVDGIVGPETKMMLYSLLGFYPKPVLVEQGVM